MAFTCYNCGTLLPEDAEECIKCHQPVSKKKLNEGATIPSDSSINVIIRPGILVRERYRVISELGKGGMGIVYLAHDTYMHDKLVAMKVIPPELSADPRAIQDLKAETSIAMEMTHNNIVRLHIFDVWEYQSFVVMEYMQGKTLTHYATDEGGKLPLEKALPLLKQIAAGLDYAHKFKPPVIHRDLKPLNILLNKSRSVAKIADFGLAWVVKESVSRVSSMAMMSSSSKGGGTPVYMAPEQINVEGIEVATDIYGFAATAYEVLSGKPPFQAPNPTVLIHQILNVAPKRIEGLPENVNIALLSGLAKEKTERPKSAGEFIKMLKGEIPIEVVDKKEPDIKVKESKKAEKVEKPRPAPKEKKVKDADKKGKAGKILAVFLVLAVVMSMAGLWVFYGDNFFRPVVALGELEVKSEPKGAEVYVNGESKGLTPLKLENLKPGSYEIKISKEGYEEYSGSVSVVGSKTASVDRNLREILGSISIKSSPSGAEVYVEGSRKGTTPLTLDKVKPGSYNVKISKEGYEEYSGSVSVAGNKTATVDRNLKKKEDSTYGREVGRDGRFIKYEKNGDYIVLDTSTKLIWAAKDNGSDINWNNAKKYCDTYSSAGYSDWRLPTQDELAALYDGNKSVRTTECGDNVYLTELIKLTCTWFWASETRNGGSEAAYFSFDSGNRNWVSVSYVYNQRVLPVRGGKN
ncbi:MAG: PEGA domain-containing protein [Desulfobacterales bacterium]|nr:PEGA domain-containing protein [Desulfobacterales bacterium]